MNFKFCKVGHYFIHLRLIIALFLICGVSVQPFAQNLNQNEKLMTQFIDGHADEALSFLENVVNINSGTTNHKGIREVGDLFYKEFEKLGFRTEWITMPDSIKSTGHLFAYRTGNKGKRILLIGHLDTVFEKDSPFQHFDLQDSVALGPGVNDMKGGDVAILYALKALNQVNALDNTSIIVAFTGDEERVGRPTNISRKHLFEAGEKSDVALGFETGIEGYAAVARRGTSEWILEVKGTQGHSSLIFSEKYGSGAVFEASRILNNFHEQLRGEEFLGFNPGIILGGTDVNYDSNENRGTAFGKTNVISQGVIVEGGLRFVSNEQRDRTKKRMEEITISNNHPGTSAKITFSDGYPAMPPLPGNYELLEMYDRVSRDLGFEPIEAYDPGKRGAADISFVAPYINSCLAGLGVTGSGAHTNNETIEISSLTKTAKRTALLIYRLTVEK
jgi:glutamate carboxypeptidase